MGEIDVSRLVARVKPQATRELTRAGLTFRRMFSGVSKKTLEQFFFQLSTMLASGVTIRESLHTLSGQHGGKASRVFAELSEDVGRGRMLSESMARHPEVFDSLALALARTGEMTGRLDENLGLIARLLERFRRIRSKVVTALLYPVVLLHLFVFIWNIPTIFLRGMWTYLLACAAILSAIYGGIALVVFLHVLLRQTTWYSEFVLSMFLFGKVALKTALARFSRALAALYGAGVNLDVAIETASETTENGTLRRTLRSACDGVRLGRSLSETFEELPRIPLLVKNMIQTGEHSGRLTDTLEKVADYYEHEAETTVHRLAKIVPVLLYLVLMLVIAYHIISFWVGRYSMVL